MQAFHSLAQVYVTVHPADGVLTYKAPSTATRLTLRSALGDLTHAPPPGVPCRAALLVGRSSRYRSVARGGTSRLAAVAARRTDGRRSSRPGGAAIYSIMEASAPSVHRGRRTHHNVPAAAAISRVRPVIDRRPAVRSSDSSA